MLNQLSKIGKQNAQSLQYRRQWKQNSLKMKRISNWEESWAFTTVPKLVNLFISPFNLSHTHLAIEDRILVITILDGSLIFYLNGNQVSVAYHG